MAPLCSEPHRIFIILIWKKLPVSIPNMSTTNETKQQAWCESRREMEDW